MAMLRRWINEQANNLKSRGIVLEQSRKVLELGAQIEEKRAELAQLIALKLETQGQSLKIIAKESKQLESRERAREWLEDGERCRQSMERIKENHKQEAQKIREEMQEVTNEINRPQEAQKTESIKQQSTPLNKCKQCGRFAGKGGACKICDA